MSTGFVLLSLLAFVPLPPQDDRSVDYGRDVQPILAGHCYKCHGPDEKTRKAKLRLDTRADAQRVLGEELLARVTSDDDRRRMPPPSEKKRLSPREVATLRRWIGAGAPYAKHWSFRPPVRPEPPRVRDTAWVRNPIDRFVLAELESRGLRPAPAAGRETLIRRLSLDLIGLPPTLAEIDAFLADRAPGAYGRLVDRLLASPHYGERWARRWLDLARYADTNGYEKDRPRTMWPWRDWVIGAINADKPFDEFTVEQIAGDMLADPTPEQIVATGFHRNTMLNEEGGIDVEEFRYAAVVDRVGTTATTWLGLTLSCAQCHTHKYDPFTQTEFFGLFALLNNCDELVRPVPDPAVTKERGKLEAEIARVEGELADRFPLPAATSWNVLRPLSAKSKNGATLEILDDDSVQASGKNPAKDDYTLEFDVRRGDLGQIRVEALRNRDDPSKGPGRTDHGNFVLGEIEPYLVEDGKARRLTLRGGHAEHAQPGHPASASLDGKANTGWAIHVGPDWRRDHEAFFELGEQLEGKSGARLRLVLRQGYGVKSTLARLRIAVRPPDTDAVREAARRRHLQRSFRHWLSEKKRDARVWRRAKAAKIASAGAADFRRLADGSILVYGNNPDRDTTVLTLTTELDTVTGLRVEALPHDSLPAGGAGRSPFFPEGGFMISEVALSLAGRKVAIAGATASHEHGDHKVAHAIDGKPDTGWTNKGNVGEPQHAVFRFEAPVAVPAGAEITLTLHQHSIHNNNLGRFRIAFTGGDEPRASDLPAELEAMLATGPLDRQRMMQHFLRTTPHLAATHAELASLRQRLPRLPTTLVVAEREFWRRRVTRRHHRGEFTKPREVVAPHVPAVLHPLGARRDRLAFARWLVSAENPLTARVIANRWWEALFGRGLVRTGEDFGTRGERPSHPELLDWLATELVRLGWSRKAMHRLIVTSATYRQAALRSADRHEHDPDNRLLGRGARFRLDAELVRDLALRASGLLTTEIGGPSVFPPQPEGIGNLSYGAMKWRTSKGPDRYRRGLYTYTKRTAPYAMFTLFDAPSGESCVPRRDRSNTPLQALTMLNDVVFVEAAQALGRRAAGESGTDAERLERVFRAVLTRRPAAGEKRALLAFLARQRTRIAAKELDPKKLAGTVPEGVELASAAVWTAVARVILNLDEAITRG